jgi:hypothetical protein
MNVKLSKEEWAKIECHLKMEVFCGKKELRPECHAAKCCVICPSAEYCEVICKPFAKAFDIDNES